LANKKTVCENIKYESIKVEGMASPRNDRQMFCHPAYCGGISNTELATVASSDTAKGNYRQRHHIRR
jgi:predicted transcriptional regulator of viral defense system